ncbi:hypothetical protein DFH29DRAFT_814081 [Suillus ampliporus]|nr:hypothetical protein DFH29DRAFT_814081 [Suillus ampliporus]
MRNLREPNSKNNGQQRPCSCVISLPSKSILLTSLHVIKKKITVLSIMMRSTNQHSNTLQSLLGMFLQSTHTPQKVIETLERIGILVSVNAIHAATQSLAVQTHQHLRSLLVTYAYDNFDVDLKTHEHKIENSTESLKHLTSGLMFP